MLYCFEKKIILSLGRISLPRRTETSKPVLFNLGSLKMCGTTPRIPQGNVTHVGIGVRFQDRQHLENIWQQQNLLHHLRP